MGLVVKKLIFSFLTALVSTKMHSYCKLMHFAINITNFNMKIKPQLAGSFRENLRLNHRSHFHYQGTDIQYHSKIRNENFWIKCLSKLVISKFC